MTRRHPLSIAVWLLGAVLVAAVPVVPLQAPPAAAAPVQADAGLVLQALALLRQHYVDRLEVVPLLNGGIGGMRAALVAAGIGVDLPDLPADLPDAQAQAAFRARFDAAAEAASGRLTRTALAHAAIRGMTAVLADSHTGFMPPEEYERLRAQASRQAQFSGIGVVLLAREGRVYIRDVIPGGPAEGAGLRPFDRVVRIDAVPTAGLDITQVSGMIRGPAGTTVTLVVERPGAAEPTAVSVVRAPIRVPPVFDARVLDDGVGYLKLHSLFADGVGREVRQRLERLLASGLRALVLDVRGNTGGYVHELLLVLNALLPPGVPVLQETRRGGATQVVRTWAAPVLPGHVPLVVLVDEGTASAAELLAAALQEHERATLVGERTSGTVDAGATFELADGSALLITVRRLATGRGRRLEGVGVTPHVAVALGLAELDQGRDSQLERALQLVRQRLRAARGAPCCPRAAAGPLPVVPRAATGQAVLSSR
ncbi:MAG: S41 family peptidase [Armatimonadota bacterium]|nr:S41 family peptidase [Armatimonadota bacterium]